MTTTPPTGAPLRPGFGPGPELLADHREFPDPDTLIPDHRVPEDSVFSEYVGVVAGRWALPLEWK